MKLVTLLVAMVACTLPAIAQSDETAKSFHLLPHLADGDGWQSVLLVTNVSQSASHCTFNVYGVPLNRFREFSSVTAAGLTATFQLEGNGGYLIWPTKNELAVASGYATLDCSAPVVAQVMFAWFGGSGEPTGMATVFSSQAGTVFQFPVLQPAATLGFAIANDTNAEASCRIVFEDGQRTNLGEATLSVPAKSNRAQMLHDAISIPGTFLGGSATVSCNQPVAMIGLHFELRPDGTISTFSTLPPAILSTTPVSIAPDDLSPKVLVLSVPEGGTVRALSNRYSCGAGETCEIPIEDEFHEVFVAQNKVGYRFNSWKQSREHFCGGQTVNCTITTDTANSFSHLEPLFDRDVVATGYIGIRKLDYRDMAIDGLFFNQVHADFDNDGVLDLFRVAGEASGFSTERQHVELWLGNGEGTYRRDDGMLVDPTAGGVNPRKVVAADFNGDDKADVIVADHGYDAEPFPGAPLLLYLSTADGKLEKAKGVEHIVGFHHSVAVGDVDGDGDIDAFVTDFLPAFLINDGKGNMTLDRAYLPKRFPMDHAGYHTSELIDVDRDGYLDLLVAGHEFEAEPSLILWGDEEPGFADSTASILPDVTDFGIVVDIDVADFDGDGNNDVLLNRVGSEPGRSSYNGMYLQLLKGREDRRTFSDVTESSIDNEELLKRYSELGWFVWLIPQDWDFDGDLDIVVDNQPFPAQSFVLINKGRSLFSTLEVVQP